MTKKHTRSKRKELRAKGQLIAPPVRLVAAQKAREKQAEEAASARVHEAREEIAHRDSDPSPPPASQKTKRGRARDLTLLLLVGITGAAGLIFWLTQRPPAKAEAAAKPVVSADIPRAPAAPPPMAAVPPPAAPPVLSSPAPATPPASSTSARAAAPASAQPRVPVEPPKPSEAPAPPAKVKPTPAKPSPKKTESADPYG